MPHKDAEVTREDNSKQTVLLGQHEALTGLVHLTEIHQTSFTNFQVFKRKLLSIINCSHSRQSFDNLILSKAFSEKLPTIPQSRHLEMYHICTSKPPFCFSMFIIHMMYHLSCAKLFFIWRNLIHGICHYHNCY